MRYRASDHITVVMLRFRVVTIKFFYLSMDKQNGQNPLVEPRFTCPKIDIFLFLEKKKKKKKKCFGTY